MDFEKLIERLKNYSIKDKALLNLQTVKDAAEAHEKLQAENESLKNKLHDSYQGHLLDVVIPRLEAELEKAKMARPIELTGKGAEAFALAAELSETKQELERVKAEKDTAVEAVKNMAEYIVCAGRVDYFLCDEISQEHHLKYQPKNDGNYDNGPCYECVKDWFLQGHKWQEE